MKTPEEIKADAATCLTKPPHAMCDRFDLNKKCKGDCGYVIKSLYELVLHYESRLAQAEKERDAAIDDLRRSFDPCTVCKKQDICEQHCPENDYNCPDCKDKHRCICHNCTADNDLWEWRGVCEENTHDQPSL